MKNELKFFEFLIEKYLPLIHMHFKELQFNANIFFYKWIEFLFLKTFNYKLCLRILDNFLIKGQYQNNDLNNVRNNDINNNKIISFNKQHIKANNISKKNIFSNNKKKKKVKVYKKKITNSSLSLSKNNKNEDIRAKINKYYFNDFSKIKVGQYSTILNESNTKYFKILVPL